MYLTVIITTTIRKTKTKVWNRLCCAKHQPLTQVKKKDGKLHPVQDYRQLNSLTIKNQYPLPLISNVIDKLKDARIFTKFDVRWGYNNVRIRPGDEWKAAFKTNCGMFEPLIMFFSLMNSPATFQAMMNELGEWLMQSTAVRFRVL